MNQSQLSSALHHSTCQSFDQEPEAEDDFIESITIDTNVSQKKDDLAFLNKLVISKDSTWKGWFDLVMMVAAIFNIFGNAYYSAFGVPEST